MRAITATDSTVYVGGNFFSANGSTRRRLAAFTASPGRSFRGRRRRTTTRSRPWSCLRQEPGDRGRQLHHPQRRCQRHGLGRCGHRDQPAVGGQPEAAKWCKSGITSLRTDGQNIFGSGTPSKPGSSRVRSRQTRAPANWPGPTTATVTPTTVVPIGKVLYTVSHAHNCEQIGGFFQSDPWSINMRHALAFSTFKTGENAGVDDYGWDYTGVRASSLLHWYPALAIGSSTGQNQAAWSQQVTTSTSRWPESSRRSTGSRSRVWSGSPRVTSRRTSVVPCEPPTLRRRRPTPSAGTARVGWQAPYDMDNE